jgi:hypothetical protein
MAVSANVAPDVVSHGPRVAPIPVTKKKPTEGANGKGSHWCWQVGPANNEHDGLGGGISVAASRP